MEGARNGHAVMIWYSIVQDYSGRDLTRASDRLVAISGVARWLWSAQPDNYLAGLLGHDMYNGLAWQTERRDQVCQYTIPFVVMERSRRPCIPISSHLLTRDSPWALANQRYITSRSATLLPQKLDPTRLGQ